MEIKDAVTFAFQCGGISAQGIKIYKKDGTTIDCPFNEMERIEFYLASSAPSESLAIDLGLPSGTKWASHNIGATNPEDRGDYYAWGEIMTKSKYTWKTYLMESDSDCGTTNDPIAGFDNISGTQFDVATVKWGHPWHIPTETQIDELIKECQWTWMTRNIVNGYEVVGPNGNSIFLPATGYRDGMSLNCAGSIGAYWSALRNSDSADVAYDLDFNSSTHYRSDFGRYGGFAVRPVSE